MHGYPNPAWYSPMWQGPPSPQWNSQPPPTQVDQRMQTMTGPQRHEEVYDRWEEEQYRANRSMEEEPNHRRHPTRDMPRELPPYIPKMPTFDGKASTWTSFIHMFELRASQLNWTAEERLNKIQLCLTGKAIDYYIKLRDQGKCRTYVDFKQQMESRFHFKEDASTLRSKFHGLRQNAEESDADWSERVMTVGYEAFRGLANDFVEGEIIRRFCSGFQDKEAAEHVLNSSPRTFEEAQRMMRKFRENRKAIHGFGSKKVRNLSTQPTRNQSPQRAKRERSFSPRRGFSPNRDARNNSQSRSSNFSQEELIRKISEVIDQKIDMKLRRSRSSSPHRERFCYVCRSPTHVAPDCPDKVEGVCYICKDPGHRYQKCPQYGTIQPQQSNPAENSDRSNH